MEVMSSDFTSFHGTSSERSPNQSPLSTSPSPEQRTSPRGTLIEQSLHVIVEPQLDGRTNFIHLMNPPTGQILSSFVAEHGSHIEIRPGVLFRVPFPHEHGYPYPNMPAPVPAPAEYSHYSPNGMPVNFHNGDSYNLSIPAQQFNPTCPVHGSPVNSLNNTPLQTGDERLDQRREKLQKKLREKQNKLHGKCTCYKYQNGPAHHDLLMVKKDGYMTETRCNQGSPDHENETEIDITLCMPPKAKALDPYSIIIHWEECISNNNHLSACQFDLQILMKGNVFKTIYCGSEPCFTAYELTPGTEYFFRLCAVLNQKAGPYSDTVSCRTSCTVPERPHLPRITQKTKNSLTLKWTAPFDGGSQITNYKLQCAKNHDSYHFDDLFVGLQKQYRHTHKLPPGTPCFYRLLAINDYGESEFSPILECLTSAGPPTSPNKPDFIESGVNYIKLKWNEPNDNGSMITEYKLEMEDPTDGYGFMVQFCGSQRSYCCKNLRRNAEYKFRVLATNQQGSSKYSPVTIFSTLPEAPGKMEKPKVNGKSKTHSIAVKWDPPKDTGGDHIVGYILECDDGQGGPFIPIYHGSDREVVVDQRKPGHTYRLRVASESKAGLGVWSPIAHMTTLPVCPKDISPPRLSSRLKPETTVITIEWDPPSETGGAAITNYVVKMARSTTADFEQVYSGANQSCTITGLSAGRDYYFKLQGTNSAGACPWSSISTLRSAPGPPDAPLSPLVSFKSPTHIRLDWTEPTLHGADITAYSVEKLENDTFQKVYQGNCLFCDIKRNIEPASQYFFKIQALTTAGNSPYSNVCTVETPPAPPGAVVNIKVLEQTSSSCLIQWRHPIENGAAVHEYVLEATGATSLICTVQRPKPSTPTNLNDSHSSDKSLHDDVESGDEISDDESDVSDDEGIQGSYAGSETSSSVASRLADDTMEYRLSGLTADASYKLRIQAVNRCGAGPFSHPIQFFTKELPPLPPSLSVSSVSYHSLKLKWGDTSASKKSMAVLNHTLQMQNQSGSFTSVYSGMGTSFTLGKLKELTPYCCRVRSRNDAGDGEFSKPKIFYTKAQPPAVIKDLKGKDISSSTMIISWRPCDKIRNDDSYEYVLQALTEEAKEFTQIYRGVDPSYTMTNLQPDQSIQFRVNAIRHLSTTTRNSVPTVPKEIKGVFSPVARIRTSPEEILDESFGEHLHEACADADVSTKMLSDTQIALIILGSFLAICIIVAIVLKGVLGSS